MIRLGVIGMSDGNGHPYSWSAIINGYNKEAMASCPFPVIPDYLGKEKYPDAFIKGAKVDYIWTQDIAASHHVAKASNINHVVDNPEDMIGKIDALLMARDDYQNHKKFTEAFLEAGIPVYVDKPLANSVADAESLLSLQKNDTQIFTCSALRYSRELEHLQEKKENIVSISAHTPKSWSLYSIHIIDPVVRLLGASNTPPVLVKSDINGESVMVQAQYQGVDLTFKSAGIAEGTINFVVEYKDGTKEEIVIGGMFYAFRSALEQFLKQVETKMLSIPREETMACMQILEMGKES